MEAFPFKLSATAAGAARHTQILAYTHILMYTPTHTRGCTMGARSVYCQQSIKTAKSFVTKTYADI